MANVKDKKALKREHPVYTLAFKVGVVREQRETKAPLSELSKKYGIKGKSTLALWIKKFGTFEAKTRRDMRKNSKKEIRIAAAQRGASSPEALGEAFTRLTGKQMETPLLNKCSRLQAEVDALRAALRESREKLEAVQTQLDVYEEVSKIISDDFNMPDLPKKAFPGR